MKMDNASISHKYDSSKYDPVKRHEYYERTKKLKGRRKGMVVKQKIKRPRLISKSIKDIPAPTAQQQQAQFNFMSSFSKTNMEEVQKYIRERSEAAAKKAEAQKQKAAAIAEKKFYLENKKLDLESVKLDLDSQQSELDLRSNNLEKLKTQKGIDPVALEREARLIEVEKGKLLIRRKKFDLESQKLEQEIQKLNPPTIYDSIRRALVHEYDPVKRHEYYERTKKLKGRGKGGVQTHNNKSRQANNSGQVNKQKDVKTSEQQKAEIKARVTAYKARLEKLKEVLAQLVAEAKKRSAENAGTKESRAEAAKKDNASKDGTSKDSSSTKGSGTTTAKEKAAAKKYYEKNKDKISLKKQEANLKDQIKEVEEKIIKIRADLKASIQKARDKTAQPSNKRKGVRQNGS